MKRYFVSYPKSGRSWIRYALTHLAVADRINFNHAGFEFNDGNKPPHNFDYASIRKRYSWRDRVIYLTRDPRDLMVSLYFQVTGRFRDFFHYEKGISEFIRDDYFGAEVLKRFREMWERYCAEGRALRVAYEECHENMPEVLRRILDFYGLKYKEHDLLEAVKESEFSRMKDVEASGDFSQPWLRPRNDSPKVRRGVVGGFRDTLNEEDIAFLNRIFEIE